LNKKYPGYNISVELSPGANLRKKGTLQRGQVEIINSKGYENDSMYLVVSCNRKWAKPDEIDKQRYALVACISHSDPKVDLYNRLKLQVTQREREEPRESLTVASVRDFQTNNALLSLSPDQSLKVLHRGTFPTGA
jgi:hypothetical protein